MLMENAGGWCAGHTGAISEKLEQIEVEWGRTRIWGPAAATLDQQHHLLATRCHTMLPPVQPGWGLSPQTQESLRPEEAVSFLSWHTDPEEHPPQSVRGVRASSQFQGVMSQSSQS